MKVQGFAALGPRKRLEPFEFELTPLEPNQVEIGITHCGICHSDIHLIDDDWKFSRYPLVPGHEIIGTVMKTGSVVKEFREGQRVGVGWQSGSCGQCEFCAQGEENLCAASEATCANGYGGYATAIRVSSRFVFPIPDRADSEGAAPLLCGGITVYSPLRFHDVRPAMRVGVVGVGGLGHLALQFLRVFGCEVTAISTSPHKAEDAHRLGAHHFVIARDHDALQKHHGRLDFILQTAPGDLNWSDLFDLLRPKGILHLVGVPAGDVRVPPFPLIVGQKSVSGSPVGGPPAIREMLDFAARHGIVATTERFPMSRVNEAIERVRGKKVRYRAVLVN